MEDNNPNNNPISQEVQPKVPDVGFPNLEQKPKSKVNVLVFVILGVLVIAGGTIFFLSRRGGGEEALSTPTPIEEYTPLPIATPTPASIDRSKVGIEIQNGTGITGEAAYLQGALKSLGYSNIKVGNASSQDNSTTDVTFAKTLDQQVIDEVTQKLETIYQDVNTKTSATAKTNVLIVTGLRKGATAKPKATATPTPGATTSPSPTPTPTSTP